MERYFVQSKSDLVLACDEDGLEVSLRLL